MRTSKGRAACAEPQHSMEVRNHPVRGRGLYASRLIRSGEVVLDEAPLLLLAAPEHSLAACAHCLRLMAGERVQYRRCNLQAHMLKAVS